LNRFAGNSFDKAGASGRQFHFVIDLDGLMTLPKKAHFQKRVVTDDRTLYPVITHHMLWLHGDATPATSSLSQVEISLLQALEVDVEHLQGPTDDSLVSFLQAEGIDTSASDTGMGDVDPVWVELVQKVKDVQRLFEEQIIKLNHAEREEKCEVDAIFRNRVESAIVNMGVASKFRKARSHLRDLVMRSLVSLKRKYMARIKGRQSFSKDASRVLNDWFYSHINDPVRSIYASCSPPPDRGSAQYPTEDEKAVLCRATELTVGQINNWFGNKRIRYKRKVLEHGQS
jgi:hypothetical protein